MKIEFFLSVLPRGQSRVRYTKSGIAYKAEKQQSDERTLEALMLPHKPNEPLSGALSLIIEAVLPIPKSKSKKWQTAAIAGTILPETKPDLDNIAKHVVDCMQRMRFLADDKQVVRMNLLKRYGPVDQVGYYVNLEEVFCDA